jgi:glycerophosphoryl diester phosphodiesterase
MEPRVVAHRGASALCPENTLAAFEMARNAGADAIELDVHETVDGDVVVIHGFEVSRTTDGAGFVHELTTDYVRSLDAGSWWSAEFSGARVPLLGEVLALDGIDFEVELKGHGKGLVERVLAVVNDCGVLDRVEFTSFHLTALCELRRQAPDACVGLFARRELSWEEGVRRRLVFADRDLLDAAVVHVAASDFNAAWVGACHRHGAAAYAANADTVDEIRRVANDGADRLSTVDPGLALTALVSAPGGGAALPPGMWTAGGRVGRAGRTLKPAP